MKKNNNNINNSNAYLKYIGNHSSYEICWLQICPFVEVNITSNKNLLRPLRNEDYEYRLCVFDKQKRKAIDVDLEIEYNYIETSLLYFIGEESKKIEINKRYACFKLPLGMKNVDSGTLIKAVDVINYIEKGIEYTDGNSISNEEYIGILKQKEIQKVKRK